MLWSTNLLTEFEKLTNVHGQLEIYCALVCIVYAWVYDAVKIYFVMTEMSWKSNNNYELWSEYHPQNCYITNKYIMVIVKFNANDAFNFYFF